MRIAVVNTQVPFVHGGAEVHASTLVSTLKQFGHHAELVSLPFKWYPASTLVDHMTMSRLTDLTESNGLPIDRVIGLKFPAYLVPHPNKVLWILHQHRTAYDLWDHPEFGDLIHDHQGSIVRDIIHHADISCIQEARAVYANSSNVAMRLKTYCGLASKVLYHPPAHAEQFYVSNPQDYLFFPSRINRLKRQSLVIQALAHCRQPVRVVFAGAAESQSFKSDLERLVENLQISDRVEWRGFISDEAKLDLYANCLGVIYPPVDEDYGYITLESMLAQKPVITTTDSGGPLEFVEHGVNGLVAEPTAEALADAMDTIWSDSARATRWGAKGREIYESHHISWTHVVEVLTS